MVDTHAQQIMHYSTRTASIHRLFHSVFAIFETLEKCTSVQ